MDQTEASQRACKMSVAIVDQDVVSRLDFERFIVHKKFRLARYSAVGVGEIASYREALINNLLGMRRHTGIERCMEGSRT